MLRFSKEKLFPTILTQPTSSFVYICDLHFRGFAVIGCSESKRSHVHTTPNFIKTSSALGSTDAIFFREIKISALCFHIRF